MMSTSPHTQSFIQFSIVALLFFGLGIFFQGDSLPLSAISSRFTSVRNFSPQDVDTNLDAEQRRAAVYLEDLAAETVRLLAERYDSTSLSRISRDMELYVTRSRQLTSSNKERRQATSDPLGALGGLLGGASGASTSNTTGGNASSIFGSLGSALSGGLSSVGDDLIGSLNGPALFLGIGLGMGSATGLNLSSTEQAQAVGNQVAAGNGMNSSGVNGVAMNFGNGLTSEIVPLVASGNVSFGGVAPAVFSLAQGMGNGTASGLGLTQTQFLPSNGTNVSDIAGNFGLGLAEPIAQSVNITNLMGAVQSGAGTINISAVMEGAGKGLGSGAAQGLGIEKTSDSPATSQPPAAATSGKDLPGAAEGFTKGLSSSFLENANMSALTSSFSSGTGGIQIPMVAEGFARGFVDGAVSGASSAGGVENLISGKMPAKALASAPQEMTGTPFNDSVNGASVAFARGLSNEGVLMIGAYLSKSNGLERRSTGSPSTGSRSVVLETDLVRRAEAGQAPIISSTFLSFIAQQGVGALQCDGIGGLASIGLGLLESGTISLKMLTSLAGSNTTSDFLPTEPSTIILDGNRFDFGLQDLSSIRINGLTIVSFGVLTTLHILLSSLAYLIALPGFLVLSATQRIGTMMSQPANITRSKKWQKKFFFIFVISSTLGTIFGIGGMGASPQFRTPHGILGFLVSLLALFSLVTHILLHRLPYGPVDKRIYFPSFALLRNPPRLSLPLLHILFLALIVQFSQITFLLGFDDLRKVTLCFVQALMVLPIAIGIGMTSLSVMIGAMAVIGVRIWGERNGIRMAKLLGVAGYRIEKV